MATGGAKPLAVLPLNGGGRPVAVYRRLGHPAGARRLLPVAWRSADDVVMTVDWGRLRHAYGWATDTPGHPAALEFGDAEAREAALDHLDIAVLHQGFPETATAPAARAVTALLADGRASGHRRIAFGVPGRRG